MMIYGLTRSLGGAKILWNSADKGASVTLSEGDRKADKAGSGFSAARSNVSLDTLPAKIYLEFDLLTAYAAILGIGTASASLSSYCGSDANGWGFQWNDNPVFWHNGSPTAYGSPAGAVNSIGALAIDRTAQKMWAAVDGVWFNSGDPAAGTNNMAFSTAIPSTGGFLMYSGQDGQSVRIRSAANYTIPSGFTFVANG